MANKKEIFKTDTQKTMREKAYYKLIYTIFYLFINREISSCFKSNTFGISKKIISYTKKCGLHFNPIKIHFFPSDEHCRHALYLVLIKITFP